MKIQVDRDKSLQCGHLGAKKKNQLVFSRGCDLGRYPPFEAEGDMPDVIGGRDGTDKISDFRLCSENFFAEQ